MYLKSDYSQTGIFLVMKILFYITSLLLFPLVVFSCNNKNSTILPPVTDPTTTNVDTSIVRMFNNTPVILWMEAAANFSRLGTADRMAAIFQKIADMGVKGVVVDVKGISGLVSYNSTIAGQLKTWNGYTQAPDFDYLQNVITEAKKKGLKVFASMSVFGEGLNYGGTKYGKVFSDTAFANIQSQVISVSGDVKKITDVYAYGMLNALQPAAQNYELSLIKELITNYNIDGFVLDYCRYYDICADFSDYSLNAFKTWAGLASVKTTDIVLSWKESNGAVVPGVTGTYYKKWLEFRAQSIHDFISKARSAAKAIKPKIAFCSYSGAWYDSYYYVGVNWASNKYDPSTNGYSSWATSTYKNTGIAELLDMFMTGDYTSTLTGAGWWTVQGQIDGAKTVLENANIHFGAVDMGNTVWSNLKNMDDAITMILQQNKGIMLFDLVHIDDPSTNQFNIQLYDNLKQTITQGLVGR